MYSTRSPLRSSQDYRVGGELGDDSDGRDRRKEGGSDFLCLSRFKMAEDIDSQLKRMAEDLKEIIEQINTANSDQDKDQSTVSVTTHTLSLGIFSQVLEMVSQQVFCGGCRAAWLILTTDSRFRVQGVCRVSYRGLGFPPSPRIYFQNKI